MGKKLPLNWDPLRQRSAIEQRVTMVLVEDSRESGW